jgi:hypothetical protein
MREGGMGAEPQESGGGERKRGKRKERERTETARRREEGVGDRLSPVVLRLGGHRASSLGRPHPNLRGAGAN